ncbi:2-polyprenyl-6-methoxyphenol hydroxylase [Actinokineospora alba]|uniref:2-polyprenyl-6-methoxyphenol hydroxylase n=1 Tax=Actinokineospora alba TaxID=504798 RepID=A0A1H0HY33_9PSEU|nr:FAD-dependent oxidoreductase [Actinokineospora alba]TDP64694.1 2-polyprenyl-6-methoxyphenol hydroxylase-like FAD-dependent oxidoreductase [Actinokineospora alba]SDI83885.1 2-polyprenyl-6-methoxyphenol hydroxylase [Actinokineospora alba]SDO24087.1 2-polyprenyl-6-methoxyphenol hydroxylase [Actinokineospora alba]
MDRTTVCVAGGGPAGMVLGLLLARAGIEVTVLEKHDDFLRDFRGDTVHPPTLDLLDDLGLGKQFAALPQSRIQQVQVPYKGGSLVLGDLSLLRGRHDYIAMVPQWDLLDLLAKAAREEPTFTLRMGTEATGLIRENGRVAGVTYTTRDGGSGRIHADLTVACDGRTSLLRAEAGLRSKPYPTPMDVWWYRLPKHDGDPSGIVGLLGNHRAAVMIDRADYWQCATLIRKGTDAQARRTPIENLMRDMAEAAPWLADRADALSSWDDVKVLDVKLDRLRQWHIDGLLCLGDAAHAMSPVGGVGINLAVQDAVAAARLLAAPIKRGTLSTKDLAKVRRRRLLPTVVVQTMQRIAHAKALKPALDGEVNIAQSVVPPRPLRLMARIPALRRIPALIVGRGLLTEPTPVFARR